MSFCELCKVLGNTTEIPNESVFIHVVVLLYRIDKADTLEITWNEWREFLLLHPSSSIHDIVHYWRHATVCLHVHGLA